MEPTRVCFEWQEEWRCGPLRSAVSLHSHTSCSREPLDFIPRCAEACPWLRPLLRRYEERYRKAHGRALDYAAAWWTPPLGPREALRTEAAQIERLGLKPLVSITDHDTIEAPLRLRLLPEGRETPVSVEWTVPWRGTFFHLGLHNLPAQQAAPMMEAMRRFTASPRDAELGALLGWLASDPAALVVFNHPYWDEKGAGASYHAVMAEQFLARYRRWIHALELNGLRPWKENLRTLKLAGRYRLPCVSGGDRHGAEPNALLNLTAADSFEGFVEEVRARGGSRVLVMRQYREPMALRILSAVCDVMRDQHGHSYGWVRWSDRVFYRTVDGGEAPLSAAFPSGREPSLIRLFVMLARVAEHDGVRLAMRQMLRQAEEVA
ncbi:MAG: hypothetical protein NZR01_00750 [Bryobacteraceae bacterium]|nr:hypothetical protein [Bryobacteraceae bacterium]